MGLLVAATVVVVEVVLSVTVVWIVPLQLEFSLLSSWHLSLYFNLPWPWMCGPFDWGTLPCYGQGSLACNPTQRSCVLARWCTGSSCPQRSSRPSQVWGWGGGLRGRRGRPWGRQRPTPRITTLLPGIIDQLECVAMQPEKLTSLCISVGRFWLSWMWVWAAALYLPNVAQRPCSLQRSFGDLAPYVPTDRFLSGSPT